MILSRIFGPLRLGRHQFVTLALSGIMLLAALSLLWIGQWMPAALPEKVEVREIALSVPPPPPPPPPVVEQNVMETPVTVQVQGSGVSVEMTPVKPNIQAMKPDLPKVETTQSRWQSLEVDWNALGLDDLDGLPNLLTALKVKFPQSLIRRGVDKVLVELDVVIDERGRLDLISVVRNPYPELHSEIVKLVRRSRFTSPTKDGNPVRARFIWPIEIAP